MKIFVPMLGAHAGVGDLDLLEKDVRLHLLLDGLARGETTANDLIFKGGTCLIKCYLDYPRFSTDLDFTWRPKRAWMSHGTNELRRALRPVQRDLLARLAELAASQGLAFNAERDVVYGRSNRMITVLLHYESIARLPSLVKVQVNFTEPLIYQTKRIDAHSLLKGALPAPLRMLESDLPVRYSRVVRVDAYDPREILAEKGRAILTRTAAKTRDLLDLYLIEKQLGLRLEDAVEEVVKKTRYAVAQAKRYRERLETADERFELLLDEDVGPLLLKPIDDQAFDEYRGRAVSILREVARLIRTSQRS